MNNKQQLMNWILLTFREAAWAPFSIFGFYLIGLALDLFDLFPPLDIPFHILGGFVITYFYRSAIKNLQNIVSVIPLPVQIILASPAQGQRPVSLAG